MNRVHKMLAAFVTLRDDPAWCRQALTVGTDGYRLVNMLAEAGLVGVWTKPGCAYEPWPQLTRKGEAEAKRIGLTAPVPDVWDDLAPLLREKQGEWVVCTAWAVGGGDPDGVVVRVLDGKATFDAAWCVCTTRSERVRLARLEPGEDGTVREVVKWLKPDDLVEVKRG